MSHYAESERAGQALDAAHGAGDPFAAAIRGARMPIVITDARQDDRPIIFANEAFLQLTGYGRDEVIGRNCRFLQGPGTEAADVARLREAIAAGREVSVEILNYRKDGSSFWNSLFLSPVRGDDGEVRYFFASLFDVSERREAQQGLLRSRTADLEQALAQKTALLHEVDHRVKNNLQLISSLMLLQSRRLEDDATRQALRGMLERVSAIATVHRRLFQSDDVTRFDVAEFIRDLTGDLAGAARRDDIRLTLDLEHAAIPTAQAAPFALVVNELIGNALKHAFPDRPGAISVSVRNTGERCLLTIADDGVGMPPEGAKKGFGLTIVQLLSQQLRATLTTEDAGPGVRTELSIPLQDGSAG